MKTMHVNLAVKNIPESVAFYNGLFGSTPTVVKKDYAKWLINNPILNFSISKSSEDLGVKHLGIQVETESELEELYGNLNKLKENVREEGHTVCCYAQSEKSWVKDPQGVEWEAFHTYGESDINRVEETDCCESTCCQE